MSELEQRLAHLAEAIDWPPTPDVASLVGARLDAQPARRRRRSMRRVLAFAALLVLVPAGVVMAVSPDARDTLLDLVGLQGATIRRLEELPPVDLGPVELPPAELTEFGAPRGSQVSLEQAAARLGAPVPVPALLGPPDRVLVLSDRPSEVTLVWDASSDLPAGEQTGLGALLTAVRGDVAKLFLEKIAGSGTRLDEVQIAGQQGYLLSGDAHIVMREGAGGGFVADRIRLAGTTALWQRGPLLVRLETGLGRDDLLRVARSTRDTGR
jgi:hypothetical protein